MSTAMMSAPSCASRIASARPCPRAAPVTSATFPSTRPAMFASVPPLVARASPPCGLVSSGCLPCDPRHAYGPVLARASTVPSRVQTSTNFQVSNAVDSGAIPRMTRQERLRRRLLKPLRLIVLELYDVLGFLDVEEHGRPPGALVRRR